METQAQKRTSRVAIILLATAGLSACGVEGTQDPEVASSDTELRGGKGGGKPAPTTTAVLTVTPNPAPLGTSDFVVTGSGFVPNALVFSGVSGWLPWYSATTDAMGSFSYAFHHDTRAGQFEILADQQQRKTWVVMATAVVEVCPTNPCQ